MGFEPTRAEHNGLAVHRLNHSATSSNYDFLPPLFVVKHRYERIYENISLKASLLFQ